MSSSYCNCDGGKGQSVVKTLICGAAVLLSQAAARATVIVTEKETDQNYSPTDGNFPAFWTQNFKPSTDLLAGLTPTTATGNLAAETGTNASAISDGVIAAIAKSNLSTVGGAGASEVIYTFNTASLLSDVQYYGGWVDNGRSDALFNVSYSTNNGATYTRLVDPTGGTFSVVGDPGRQNQPVTGTSGNTVGTTFTKYIGGSGTVTNFIDITDSSGTIGNGALITNLEFDFMGGRNGYDGVEELAADVAMPEPAILSGAAGCLLLGTRVLRRRRI